MDAQLPSVGGEGDQTRPAVERERLLRAWAGAASCLEGLTYQAAATIRNYVVMFKCVLGCVECGPRACSAVLSVLRVRARQC
jgi:hypothetical protein